MPNINLPCIADAEVKSASPDTNFGTATTATILLGSTEVKYYYAKFDFSLLPSNAIVTKVEFRFYVNSISSTMPVVPRILEQDFNENTITYNSQPSSISINDSFNVSITGWNAVVIKSASLINNGLRLGGSTTNISMVIQTRENTNKPYLYVEYELLTGTKYDSTQNTYVLSSSPTTNYNAAINMNLGIAGFSQFQNITAPQGYKVSSLKLWVSQYPNYTINSMQFYTFSEAFDASTITYNNMPTKTIIDSVTGPNLADNTYISYELTDITNDAQFDLINQYGLSLTSSSFIWGDGNTNLQLDKPFLEVKFALLPPAPPLPLYPFSNIVDKDSIIRFTWQQNFVSSDSELVWNDGTDHTIAIANGNNYYDMPASTLPAGIISWKVRCNAVSSGSFTDFSTPVSFTSATKTATPNILTTGNIATALPLITWDPTAQVKYRIWIKDGTTVVEYRELASTDFQYQTTVLLENSKTYTIELQVADVFGLWSYIDTSSITTVFDTPTLPTFVLTESNGVLNFAITSNANTDYHQLLRLIDGVYTVIRDNIGLNETFDEYEATSGVLESYKIRSFSPVGGYIDTAAQTITINLTDCFISNEAGTLALHARYEPVRQITTLNDATQNNFAGRTKPVSIYGDMVYSTHDYSFEFFNQADVNKLVQMIKNKDKVLIRDNRGRLQWVAIGSIREKDTRHGTAVDLINVFEVER